MNKICDKYMNMNTVPPLEETKGASGVWKFSNHSKLPSRTF